jgi:hypothetical protein
MNDVRAGEIPVRAGGEIAECEEEILEWLAHTRTLAGRLRILMPTIAATLAEIADEVEEWPEPPGV